MTETVDFVEFILNLFVQTLVACLRCPTNFIELDSQVRRRYLDKISLEKDRMISILPSCVSWI